MKKYETPEMEVLNFDDIVLAIGLSMVDPEDPNPFPGGEDEGPLA